MDIVVTEMTKFDEEGYKYDGLSMYNNIQVGVNNYKIRELTDKDTKQVLNWTDISNKIFYHP